MFISNTHADGTTDVVIRLTPGQMAALGADAETMGDWFDTALVTMAALRARWQGGTEYDTTDWHRVIAELEHRLLPRLQGVRDAAIRAHAAEGGSVGDLARAMDVKRSTAQYRRDALRASGPGTWEKWAADGGPQQS